MGVTFGDGRDGSLLLTNETFNLNTDTSGSRSYADGIAYKVTVVPSTKTITIGTTPNGFAIGDYFLLINLQGTSSDYTDVGNYELLKVDSVGATYVVATTEPIKTYSGLVFSNQKVVIQRVPQYENVTLESASTLTTSAYDRLVTTPTGAAGYYTGIVAMMVYDILTIDSSQDKIDVVGKGYKGGAQSYNGSDYQYGRAGERTSGHSVSIETTSNYKAGGGGGCGKGADAGGGGGGHGTAGTSSINPILYSSSLPGIGAAVFGNADLSTINFGGGGGSAGSHSNNRVGVAGGPGGGIIYLHVNILLMPNGSITAAGGPGIQGVYSFDSASGAGGGGGAGGTIYLRGRLLTTPSASIIATGGVGGPKASSGGGRPGGAGGHGIIRVEYTTFNSVDYPNTTAVNLSVDPDPYTSEFEPAIIYYFDGYIREKSIPVVREIRLYNRSTGAFINSTTSNSQGYYNMEANTNSEHYIVVLDNSEGLDYNALIKDKLMPEATDG